jgi:pyruvate,water dikinase
MSNLFAKDALVVPFELRMADVESVGGKNASLGEMISQLPNGVRVPTGFATTAFAFRAFLKHDGLVDRINQKLDALDVEDVRTLATVGAEIRAMVEAQPFPADLEKSIHRSQCGQYTSFICRSFFCNSRRFARCFFCRPARDVLERCWH